MKHYRILSFITEHNGVNHLYTLNRNSGDYFCPTLNNGDRRNETDFICEPNSFINSVENIEGQNPHNGAYDIGTRTFNGPIRGFKIRKARVVVIYDNAEIPLEGVRREIQPKVNNINNENMAKAVKTAPSRSAAAKAAPKLAVQNPFEDLENKILKAEPIRLAKFFKKNLPETLEEFLKNFFTTYNNEHATIYVANKSEQTSTNRRRSLGDVFLICKYYYPTCTLQEVVKFLFKAFPGKFKGFRSSFCNTIKKRVFYYAEGAGLLFQDVVDEYGKDNEYYLSKIK